MWKPANAWKISGVIEGDLKFSSNHVTPSGQNSSWRFGGKLNHVQKLRFGKINLAPTEFDALSKAKRDKVLQRPPTPSSKHSSVEFHAVLFDCEQSFLNAATFTRVKNDFLGVDGGGSALDTFIDRSNKYDFALLKREKDIHVHFRSKSQFRSVSREDDWRRFYALLAGVGLTHGFQPWPYRVEFWRAGRKITDQICVPHRLTKTPHAPFDRAIGFVANLGKKGARNSVVRLAARFFEKQTPLSKELSHLLFLFRESGSASFRIKTLALCSLLEGAVNLIFDQLKLEEELRRTVPQFDEYLKLRDGLVKRLRRLATKNKRSPIERLAGSLGAAKEFRVQDKFKAICGHFGLAYDGDMARHLAAWERKRNPLMHGKWKDEDSDFSDQALIAGAINIFALKLIGYSGRMKFNAFAQEPKDRYKVI
jgi:hypothetical protein